jgi:hypothetical protein
MNKAISPEVKNTRARFRLITRETERVIDKAFNSGYTAINLYGLTAQVALNTCLPLDQVCAISQAYVGARQDLCVIKGKIKKQ